MGAEPVENYDKKVSCCGGALAFSEPEKSQALIKDIIEAAYDGGADMIVTPCPVCQMNVEVYQDQINPEVQDQLQDAGGVLPHPDERGLRQVAARRQASTARSSRPNSWKKSHRSRFRFDLFSQQKSPLPIGAFLMCIPVFIDY